MDDTRVGAELERLAATDPLGPIDPLAMLDRGRRSRRTRRLLAGGGGIAAVAVVAIGAALLPNLNAMSPDAAVAGPSTADFSAVPGVPRGEAGTGVKLSYAEANRRCALRYPEVKRPLRPATSAQAGALTLFQLERGDDKADCMVPGGDKPAAALIEAARRDPVPTTPAGQLRNCSVGFWTDMTKWRVVAADVDPGVTATVQAVSPSGRTTVYCSLLGETKNEGARLNPNSRIVRAAVKEKTFRATFELPNDVSFCAGGRCTRLVSSSGRLPSTIARITIQQAGGGKHEIKVNDGWYALAWLNTHPATSGLKFTAHYQDGHTEVVTR